MEIIQFESTGHLDILSIGPAAKEVVESFPIDLGTMMA